jgi:hypothetical protein
MRCTSTIELSPQARARRWRLTGASKRLTIDLSAPRIANTPCARSHPDSSISSSSRAASH